MDQFIFCRGCLETKPRSEMNSINTHSPRGRCKACHNAYNINKRQEGKIAKNPDDYKDCNNCDKSFYKYKGTGFYAKRDGKLKDKCPHCGSKDFE